MADIEAVKTAFDRFDINKDGLITASEYKSVMAQLGDFNVTETVAEAIIKAHDSDGDGQLDFEEFLTSRKA